MRSGLGLLGLGALCAAAVSVSSAGGCQADSNSTGSAGPGSGGGGSGSTSSNNGGGGSTSTDTTSSGTAGGGIGGGGEGGSLPTATIQDITSGTIGEGVDVELHGVVAMSTKYLVSKSNNTGSCLWGVYISAPGLVETGPNTGVLAVSYGTPGVTDAEGYIVCPNLESEPAGDAFPDDVAPGDVLDVTGETSYFLLNMCASQPPDTNPSQVKQRQLAKVAKVERTSTGGPVPTPHTLTPDELAGLVSPMNQVFHDQWGGVKVRVAGPVAPVLQPDQNGDPRVVGAFGNIYVDLNSNGIIDVNDLRVGDKIYFVKSSANECHQGPDYPDLTVEWTRIDGFSTIDFCNWSLQPANKCLDFDPPGEDCVGGLMCP